jgi:maleamate amidohydrolase
MAVWDQFLTERDKEHLRVWGAFSNPHKPFGQRPALLIVDDYYEVLGTEPKDLFESVKEWPMSTGRDGWEAIYRTRELLAAARAAKIPVIFTNNAVPNMPSWSRGGRSLTPEQKAISQNIVEEIAPLPSELVIHKTSPSAFWGTPLIGYLTHHKVDTVITCGETTSGCVRASVVDACSSRFVVGVVEDCTFDRTEAAHAMNLFDMHTKYAKVIGLAEAVQYFDSIAEGRS